MTTRTEERYVLVATKTRRWSVVAGVLESESEDGDRVVLRNARMIVYYSMDAHALYGVATNGPGKDARVSPRVNRARIGGIEHLLDCSAVAREAIEAEPWC